MRKTLRYSRQRQQSRNAPKKGRFYFVEELQVVGGYYHYMKKALDQGEIEKGTDLVLEREPDNQFDVNAIAVWSPEGLMLGYIPRIKAIKYASLLDSGVRLRLRVINHVIEPRRINARMYIWK